MKYFFFTFVLIFTSCSRNGDSYENQGDYDLNAPQVFALSENLLEISGLAFGAKPQNDLWAVADEIGEIYKIQWGEKQTETLKFGPEGDYEDLAISQNQLYVLRSDGALFVSSFPTDSTTVFSKARVYPDLLPQGEYEGLYVNEKNQLYVLCKKCKQEEKDAVQVHVLQIDRGIPEYMRSFAIDLKGFYAQKDQKKRFRPSGLAQHKLTREWYIISSVNNTLLVSDSSWNIRHSYYLHPSIFEQPEGIGFDHQHNLYISNEGKDGVSPNISRFNFIQN